MDDIARRHQLTAGSISAGQFTLRTLQSPSQTSHGQLHVYIGGDGIPWRNRQASANPSGKAVVAARLMALDPMPSIYLTRPCYQLVQMPANCPPSMWTSDRYSKLVVTTMANAISQLADRYPGDQLTLYGYSGGGTLALLIANELAVATPVVTIAANLDTEAWIRFHQLLPLTGSLNPATALPSPTHFKQIHLLGQDDEVVPGETIAAFRAKQPQAQYRSFRRFDHHCCWEQQWPDILQDLADSH